MALGESIGAENFIPGHSAIGGFVDRRGGAGHVENLGGLPGDISRRESAM